VPSEFTASTPTTVKSLVATTKKQQRAKLTTEQQLLQTLTLLSGGIALVWVLLPVIYGLSPRIPHVLGLISLQQALGYATEGLVRQGNAPLCEKVTSRQK
jgi:DMSO reductase anchor subunit